MNKITITTRFIRKDATGPMEIKVGGESKWICMCGLSINQPSCDGSHRRRQERNLAKFTRITMMVQEQK